MANLVNLDRVSKGYGPTGPLLTDVSLGVADGDRIGVVGLNGAGKSTLLQLLTKTIKPDAGRVTHRRDVRVLALPQALELAGDATVRDVVLGQAWLPAQFAADHEWASSAGVRTVLTGLGLPGIGLDAPIQGRSGGEQRRVALAALLVRPADLLVLDEPTNHLDLDGVDWLAGYLRQRAGAVVVVTHDRWFLDAVTEATWEVADQRVRAYEGGFAAWTLARAERLRLEQAAEGRRQNLLRKEIAWLRRGAPARTSKPKFRIEAANALIADVPPARDSGAIRRLATARLGRQVYDLERVSLHAGDKLILREVTWQIGPGDRIGVLGPNGAGKTTLLRLLAGAAQPSAGTVRRGATVRVAYLSQELAELPVGLRLLEAVQEVALRVRLGDRELSAAQLAEAFGFTDRQLWTPVPELSGGERRRLQLLRVLATEPNVLLLDEPGNDLDTDSMAALEDLLDTWPGTLVVASHDRYMIERVTDSSYALFGDQNLTHLPAGVEQYLARIRAAGSDGDRGPARRSDGDLRLARGSNSDLDPARGCDGDLRLARKELARLQRQVDQLEQRERSLQAELLAHATDYERLVAVDATLREVRDQRDRAEHEWLELAERIEHR